MFFSLSDTFVEILLSLYLQHTLLKVVSGHAIKEYMGRSTAPLIFNLGTTWR